MKRVFLIITLFMLSTAVMFGGGIKQKTAYYDLIESSNMLETSVETKSKKVDLNRANLEKLIDIGVTKRIAHSILDYIEITGGFKNVQELRRVKGIGDVTYGKLKDKFVVKTPPKKVYIYINEASDEELKLFGFDKKYIKKINEYRDNYGMIRSNIDLMKILPKGVYDRYKDRIQYQ